MTVETATNHEKAERIHTIVNMLLELDEITLARMEEALRMHLETPSSPVIIRDK